MAKTKRKQLINQKRGFVPRKMQELSKRKSKTMLLDGYDASRR